MNSAIRHFAGGDRALRRGDVVVAMRDLGKRAWCSGVPFGTVGTVLEMDWLGDLRVEFSLDGDWLERRVTVEKVVAACDLRLVRAVEHR